MTDADKLPESTSGAGVCTALRTFYFVKAEFCTSSVPPQLAHVHVSSFTPISPNIGSGFTPVRRIAGWPQAGQGLPAVTGAFCSNRAIRFSRASSRAGASRTRFHSGHLSRSAKISESIANVAS